MGFKEQVDLAVEEYKSAIEHAEKYASLIEQDGVLVCHSFYKEYGKTCFNVHIHEGIEKIAESVGVEINKLDRHDDTYNTELWFEYGGLRFFELVNERLL